VAEGCPIITGGDPAVNQVTSVQSAVMGFAGQAYGVALAQANALNHFDISPYNFTVHFDVDGEITGYHRPAGVDDPDIEFDPNPVFEPLGAIQWPSVTVDAAPIFTAQPLPINLPAPPPLDIPADISPPTLLDPSIPDAPIFTLPAVPQLRDLVIPNDPLIRLPEFTALAPVRDFGVPNFDFSFTPAVYASELLDKVKGQVLRMLAGGTGLPAAVEQALFERAVLRDDQSALAALEEADEEMSARGFQEPNGIWIRRRADARQANRTARANLNRDIYIKAQETEIENLRFAVQQGIALETVLEQLFLKQQELLLDSLKFQADLEVKFLDAEIAIANLDATIYQAQAAVFRDLIQAALAKLEIFKAKIEAQRIIGEINREEIELYTAQLNGVHTLIDIYNANINAANAISQNNNMRVQAYVGMQQGRSETIRGIGYAFDAYKTQTEAEKIKPDIFDSQARAFGSIVSAYGAQQNIKIERGRFDVSKGQAIIQEWVEKNRNEVVKLQAKRDIVSTKLDVFKGFLDRMRVEASIEETASASNARILQLAISKAEADVNAQLKSVDLRIDQNEKVRSIVLEAMRTAATVAAQLAGSAMSALNASASIGHSSSQSSGCSTSFSGSLDSDEG
jgi:hypothetical protein